MGIGFNESLNESPDEQRRLASLNRIPLSRFVGALLALLGGTVMAGWWLQLAPVVRVLPHFTPMVFNTALCFALAGSALLLPMSAAQPTVTLGSTLCGISALVLAEHLFGIDLGIDWASLHGWVNDSNPNPGQMSVPTAIGFLGSGAALVLATRVGRRRTGMAVRILTLGVGAIGAFGLAGYLVNAELLFPGYPFVHVAAHTAAALVVLAIGLQLAWRRMGWAQVPLFVREDDRITFVGATILVTIALGAGIASFAILEDRVQALVGDSVLASLTRRSGMFQDVIQLRETNARIAATRPAAARNLRIIRAGSDDGSNLANLRAVVDSFLSQGFSAIAYYDIDGKMLASGGAFAGAPEISVALATPDKADLAWSGGFLLRHRIPMRDAVGEVGSVLTEQPLAVLTRLVQESSGAAETWDTGLCARSGNELRCFPQRLNPVAFSIPRVNIAGDLLPASRALLGQTGTIVTRDYRGQNVLAAYGPVGNLGLGMVVKVDAAEVFRPIREQLELTAGLLVALVCAGTLLLRARVRPLATKLVDAEGRYRAVSETASDAIISADSQGNMVYFNHAAERIFGYSASEVLGRSLTLLMPARFQQPHQDGFRRFIATGQARIIGKTLELVAKKKNGQEFPMEISVATWATGKDMYFTAILRDITLRKKAEADLKNLNEELEQRVRERTAEVRAVEESYRMIFENSVVGIFAVNAAGQVISANPALARMLGFESSQAMMDSVGSVAREIYVEPGARKHFRKLLLAQGVVENFEAQWRRRDGSVFWVSLSGRRIDEQGRGLSHIGVAEDITQRKRSEEELRRFRVALDNSADMILIIDRATMRMVDVNDTACRLLGYTREELLRMGPQDTLPVSREELEKKYDELIANPSLPSGMESYYRCKDGSQLPFESTRHVLRSGDTWLIAAVSRDIRARIASEKALRESEAGLRRAQVMAKLASVVTGPDGSFESWSETLPELIGVRPDQVPPTTRAWLDLLHPEDRPMFREKAIEAGKTHARTKIKYRLRRADDTWIQVRQTMDPLRAGAEPRWFNTIQDVTEQREAEEKIERLNRVYALLSGINSLIVRVRDRDELFREACRVAVEQGKFPRAWIGMVDRPAMRIQPVAWSGMDRQYIEKIPLGIDPTAAQSYGLAGRAVTGGRAAIAQDMASDPRILLPQEARHPGTQSVVVLPLMLAGEAVGVLTLYATEVGFFDEEEIRLLDELAGDISFALEHIDKEQKVGRLTRVQAVLSGINAAIVRILDRHELFQEACRIAVESGGFRMAWIGIVDRDAEVVKPVASAGDVRDFFDAAPLAVIENKRGGHGLAGRAVRDMKPMISNDARNDPQRLMKKELAERGINSVAIIPLIVGREAVGVLALYAAEVGAFDDEEMRLLLELAGDVAFALEHIGKAEKVDYLSYYDSLTGLANRTLFHERLEQSVLNAAEEKRNLGLALFDIERFKSINDSLGRQAGDALLKQIAERLAHDLASVARAARTGADQFAKLIPDLQADEFARYIEKRLGDVFGEPFRVNDTDLRISARAGLAIYPADGADADTLFRNAEAALKKAKATGERYMFYEQAMTERVAEKLALENKLRQALEKDEFVLHYQPKVELETRKIVGVEALIRWQSPELGLVPPMKFIPLMEETGLILQVGAWALRRAALDHKAWVEAGLKAPRVAVNVSPIQLRQRDFVRVVERAIMEGIAPTGIDLEITESLIMEDIHTNIEKLILIRKLGVAVAIDDFGTGYSSLSYLARLPVETLKIDRSFVITMLEDPNTATLVQTMISLAHSFRLKVVAEGVDSEEQAKMLRLLRCDQMQGYLFSKPVPNDALVALLRKSS